MSAVLQTANSVLAPVLGGMESEKLPAIRAKPSTVGGAGMKVPEPGSNCANFVCLVWGLYPAVLRTCSWLWLKVSPPYVVSGLESWLDTCKTSTLLTGLDYLCHPWVYFLTSTKWLNCLSVSICRPATCFSIRSDSLDCWDYAGCIFWNSFPMGTPHLSPRNRPKKATRNTFPPSTAAFHFPWKDPF